MMPAHQRFKPHDRVRCQVNDRLIVHGEITAHQGVAKFLDEREATEGRLAHPRSK